MSRTVKGKPGPGTDWWGKRPFSKQRGPGKGSKWWKRKTHKIERQQAKEDGNMSMLDEIQKDGAAAMTAVYVPEGDDDREATFELAVRGENMREMFEMLLAQVVDLFDDYPDEWESAYEGDEDDLDDIAHAIKVIKDALGWPYAARALRWKFGSNVPPLDDD